MFWRRLTGRADRDLDRELRAHLDVETGVQREAGLPPQEARYAAQRAFGNTALVKEDTRAMWGFATIERLAQDFRYALRTLRHSPGFTTVAVLSLALGIGANTAIFTFVNAALLKPLPYPDAERIVALQQRPLKGGNATFVAPRSFVEWRERAQSFESLAIAQIIPINTQGVDGAEQISGLWTTPELFRVFGVAPLLGRVFTSGESPAEKNVVVLSHGYWQRRFGSNPNILGKPITMGSSSAVVVGVMPAGFRVGSLVNELYSRMPLERNKPDAVGSRSFLCFGRLRPGVSVEAVRAEMTVVADQVGRQNPIEKDWGVVVTSLRDYLVRDNRVVLLVLLATVAFVLVIACANVAGLLLTRGVGRRSELALRASLGAGRGRLVQQLVSESVVLSVMGGALGLLLGFGANRALVRFAPDAVAFGQMADARLDAPVLAFTIALSFLTAIVFGLAPAWQTSRFHLQSALKEQGRGAADTRAQQRFRSALVIGEVALAVVLLVGAGLLLRTFSHLLQVKLGFAPENVLTMRMIVMGDVARRANFVESVLDRVETLPAVRSVGTIQFLPLGGWTNDYVVRFVGRAEPATGERIHVDGSTVSRGYFAAMDIPVLRGRDFGRQDQLKTPPVALVNESFVKKYSPNADPIGQRILGDWRDAQPREIVGVVGDIRHNGLTAEARPTIFLAQAQAPGYITYLVMRTSGEPQALAAAVRREIQQVDPREAVTAVQTMDEYVSAALSRPKIYATLLGTFATLALLLAAIGLYGLMAYGVSRRTHEIGVRMALGAQRHDVLRSVLGQGARLTLAGLAAGIVSAIALSRLASRFFANLLYGVHARDLATYGAVAALLGAVALIAAYVPARRASRVDPVVALRYE